MTFLLALAAGLALGLVGSMPPAGPIALLVLQHGFLRRFREGAAVALGGATAETAYAALALFGMAAVMERFPAINWIARTIGIAALLALGVYFLRFRIRAVEPPPAAPRAAWRSFLLGFGIAASNLTLVVTWSTLVAVAYSLGAPRLGVAGMLAFAAGAGAGIFLWFAILLWMLRRFGPRLTDLVAARCIRGAGILLLVLASVSAASQIL